MAQRMLHPCIYAEGNNGINAYHCKKIDSNCTCQFFCHNEHYWKPLYQIKCPNFKDVHEVDEKKEEQAQPKIEENKENKQ